LSKISVVVAEKC